MGDKKQKWTAEEEEALKAGVAKHGIGKWKNILTDPDYAPSLANRSNIDLKDKWRNLGAQAARDEALVLPITCNKQAGEELSKHNDVESKKNEPAATEFEQLRQQRIKENLQKREKMGIFDLSRKLSSEIKPPSSKKSKTCQPKITTLPSSDTTRRSSRSTTIARVDYAEKRKRASMVGGKRRGRPRKQKVEKSPVEELSQHNDVESKKNESAATEYEQLRQQRIKENLQKMEKMGILDLSRKLSSENKPPSSKKSKTSQPKITTLPSSDTTRRSSRLTTIARVDYAEKVRSPTKAARGASNNKIHLKRGSQPEIYTAEHEKLFDGKSHGPDWLVGRHGKIVNLTITPDITEPYVEELTTKIRQNLESDMEAKVNKKVQENITWILKKLEAVNPNMNFDIGDICATTSSDPKETGSPLTQGDTTT